jgi:hypothetical protein
MSPIRTLRWDAMVQTILSFAGAVRAFSAELLGGTSTKRSASISRDAVTSAIGGRHSRPGFGGMSGHRGRELNTLRAGDCRHLGTSGKISSWHVRDVTPAATRAAAIKGSADLPARSPFMLRPRCVHSNTAIIYSLFSVPSIGLAMMLIGLSLLAGFKGLVCSRGRLNVARSGRPCGSGSVSM